MSLDDARRKCVAWRRDYNEERPHSAIGNKALIELISRSVAYGPRCSPADLELTFNTDRSLTLGHFSPKPSPGMFDLLIQIGKLGSPT
jgi:hypothetical protein